MTTIAEMLHRRNDLSTFLVHFTKPSDDDESGFAALKSILWNWRIEARTAYGAARNNPWVEPSQRVVCFTETPLEHSWTMTRELAERRTANFAPYGVAFTKTHARREGCNPVWYINHTRGTDWPSLAIDDAVSKEIRPYSDRQSIFRITPYIEQMGDWSGTEGVNRKEFWWEREWRHVGDFSVQPEHTVAVLAPSREHTELRQYLAQDSGWEQRNVPILDAEWGLERMIAVMSGVNPSDLGPFPG